MRIVPINLYTKSTPKFTGNRHTNNKPNIALKNDIMNPEDREFLTQFGWNEIPFETNILELPSERFFHRTSTFRDEELFDNSKDILIRPKYLQYSVDDVPLRDDLWMLYSKSVDKYNQQQGGFYPETSYRDEMKFCKVLHSPWNNTANENIYRTNLDNFMRIARIKIKEISDDHSMPSKIFKNCNILRRGKNEKDLKLCKLALELFENSKEWGEVEEQILHEVKIPIYGKIYGAVSYVKYRLAMGSLLFDHTNKEILKRLKNINPLDVYRLRG